MLESGFKFLFKYPLLVFEQGRFVLGASRFMWVVALLTIGAGVYTIITYRGLTGLKKVDRGIILGLRIAGFALLVFCLLRPTLILKVAVPQQNFLGVLIDDSRSMQIADVNNQARSKFIEDNFTNPEGPLLASLSKKFVVRPFRFSSSAERLQSAADLKFQGTATRLGEALDRARDELSGLPLAGVVMISDGDDTSNAALDQSIAALKAQSIPVFTVGVGQEKLARDIQVSRVEAPRVALKDSTLVVDVVITQTGYAGAKVPLIIESDGHIVSQQEITLPPDGEASTEHARFKTTDAGARTFKFRIDARPGEQVTQNNARDALVEVVDRKEKMLYVEGELRYEPKYIRQALETDKNLQVVLLQRTAQDKYLRLGLDSAEELAGGFPTTKEELFKYRAIILGSVEASSFSPDQIRMIAEFVDQRGGGLLALGGHRAFAEGGWTGTPVADVLPVVLDSKGPKETNYFSQLTTVLSRAGTVHPVTRIADNDKDLAAAWKKLPQLSSVNPIRDVKPGATELLKATDDRARDQTVLAYQRYGRGKAIAFTAQDAWVWRMQLPFEDSTHHSFWQRMLRWVVDGVPDQVGITTSAAQVEPGNPVALTAQIYDPSYAGVNNSRTIAHVTAPSGKAVDVPMEWTVKREGEYSASFTPDEPGLYSIRVDAARDGKEIGKASVHVRVGPSDAEYFDAAMRAPLLKRIADETGGRFFHTTDTASLTEAITYSGRGVTVVEYRELWDMPMVFFIFLSLAAGEWAFRRARGIA